MKIKVKIRFLGYLALKIGTELFLEVEEKTTLRDVAVRVLQEHDLSQAELHAESLRISPGYLRILLNGREQNFNTIIQEGDEVVFLPPLVGGDGEIVKLPHPLRQIFRASFILTS